jgi:hypothetical protein
MRSSSRNSRTQYRALTGAAVASLLLGSAVASAVEPHSFVMAAYSNEKGGPALAAGHYATAVDQLDHTSMSQSLSPSSLSNNRCVAYTVTKQLDAARVACDQAVHDALSEKNGMAAHEYWTGRQENEYLAMALSNRAVLRSLSTETAGAERDLKRAEQLSPQSDFVARNLTVLHSSQNAVAQITVAPH